MNTDHLSIIPRVTDKSYRLSAANTYVFRVPGSANKQQIAAAIAKQFDVTVLDVQTLIQKGKKVRRVQNGKSVYGHKNDLKKAYVTLKDGDKIDAYSAVEDAEEKK